MPEVSARKLAMDCRIVMRDVQEMVRTMAGEAIQHIGDLQWRQREQRDNGQERTALAARFTDSRTTEAAESAGDTWKRVALAAGIGLLIGLLIRPIVKRIG